MIKAWRSRNHDPRQAKFLTLASLRWVIRHRAFTPWYLKRYWRFALFRLRNPHIVTTGMVFLGDGVEVTARPGFGRLVLGRWVHVGHGTSIRCHEGNMAIGDKVVFGGNIVVNAYLDVTIGAACIVADMVYITDFDHAFGDVNVPIKDQGITKTPVKVGDDVWIGTKATVTRGTEVGRGSVVAANAVVTKDIPAYSVAVGVPARVVRNRHDDHEAELLRQAALADMAAKLKR